jgi:hypothetical protein
MGPFVQTAELVPERAPEKQTLQRNNYFSIPLKVTASKR